MPAVDPTYPLYPIACVLSSVMLLLTLSVSFARQSWNLGVAFLCFWLFWELLAAGISSIVWSDNYNIKLYVYCDIVTRLQLIVYVVKPMCTLIIVRRLHLIASLRSVELPSTREKRNNMILEWTLGLLIPLIVAGPFYYVLQHSRFDVLEGTGCTSTPDNSILTILLINSWSAVPPLVSLTIYYPKVVWVFYKQRRDTNRFLRSNNSISHTNYFRILALASIDVLFTLPTSIANLVIANVEFSQAFGGHLPFYLGWDNVHSDWTPAGISYAQLSSQNASTLPQFYLASWTSPVLAFIIFGLFGLTAEARAAYWRAICLVCKWFGWKPTLRKTGERPTLGTMEFGAHPQEISLDAELGSRPSFVNFEPEVAANLANAEGTSESGHRTEELVEGDSLDSAIDIEHRVDKPTAAASPCEGS